MRKNELVELEVTDLTEQGSGVGRAGEMVVFVPQTAPGDRAVVRIVQVRKHFCYGKLEQLLVPSSSRVESDCLSFPQCGGCTLRHLSYQAELEWKRKRVSDSFSRLGGINCAVDEIVGALSSERYRNKAQYPFAVQNGQPVLGFYAPRSHRVIPCTDCRLQPEVFGRLAAEVLAFARKYQLSVYDEHTSQGLLRNLYLRRAEQGEIMVCLVCSNLQLPRPNELVDRLRRCCPDVATVLLNRNPDRTNVILGKRYRILYGSGNIRDTLCGVAVSLSAPAFYQVNHAQAERLYQIAAGFAGKGNLLLDLYCGAGTIGLSMAKQFQQVIGVEVVPQAVENAVCNARANGIENAVFLCADAGEAAARLAAEEKRPDVIVIDPPRKGCSEQTLDAIGEMLPERVVMVSCNPATAARDCTRLQEMGYSVQQIVPVDLFPRTTHVETCVLLSHKKPDSVINVKVEFGEGEGKVPLDNIAKRAEAYKPKERVTYKMIKEYIQAKYGFKVHTAYIAEVKRDLGLPMYDAPNAAEESKQPRKHPTVEKVEAIKDALKYFEAI